MKTTQALEATIGDLLIEHKATRLPGDVYEDLALDIAAFRGNRDDRASIDRLLDSASGMLAALRRQGDVHSRTFETVERAVEAVRNELRGPAVAAMADALLAAIRTLDPSAMIDDLGVNGVRTFSIDAMFDAETMGRLLLEAADRQKG